MKRVRVLVAILGVMSAATAAFAQGTPKVELSGGYQLLHFEEETFSKGWYVDVAGNLNNMVGIVGEVGGVYKSRSQSGITVDANAHEFMGGVRVNSRQNANVVPFAQVLVGGVRGSVSGSGTVGRTTVSVKESNTDFALQVGGGVNLMVRAKVGVRVGADYLRVFSEGEGTNMFRFAAGIVLGLP